MKIRNDTRTIVISTLSNGLAILSTDYVARFRFVSASNRLAVAEEDFAFVQSAFVQSRSLGTIHESKEV
jgi:hypothetical protein